MPPSLLAVLACALGLRLVCAMLFQGAHYPDETFQAFEQAHRYAFGYGLRPWEFEDGLRSTLPPLLLSLAFQAGHAVFGTPDGMLALARASLVALSLVPVATIYWAGLRRSPLHAWIGGLAAAGWWELVYFSYRPLTEALAADFLLAALALMTFRETKSRQVLVAAGLCLGFAAILRVQFAPAVGLIGLAIIGTRIARIGPLAAGAAGPLVLFGAADWLAWGYPFHAPIAAFRANTIADVASSFGTDPAYAYVTNLVLMLGPVFVALIAPLVLRARAYWLSIATAVVILASHSLIQHKEYRFVFVCGPILVVAAAFASADLLVGFRGYAAASPVRQVIMTGLLALFWAGCSLVSATTEIGRNLWLLQAEKVEAFRLLAARSDMCGLLLDEVAWQETGGYAALHRNVPIYQRGEGQGDALPNPDGFNYVLARVGSPSIPGFEPVKCFTSSTRYNVCVRRRPGSCLRDTASSPLASQRLGDPRTLR